jgi:hypothetical protein
MKLIYLLCILFLNKGYKLNFAKKYSALGGRLPRFAEKAEQSDTKKQRGINNLASPVREN